MVTSGNVTSTAAGMGGGLFVNPNGSSTAIQNSIISGNSVINGAGPDVSGAVQSLGHNLIGQINGSTGWKSTDLTGTIAHPLNASLSPLASFGGPTRHHRAAFGKSRYRPWRQWVSPDRHRPRPAASRIRNGTVDIGAVEVQPSTAGILVTAHTGLTAFDSLTASLSTASFTTSALLSAHLRPM